jgi:hypothetical protein
LASLGLPTQLQSPQSAAVDRQVNERPVGRHQHVGLVVPVRLDATALAEPDQVGLQVLPLRLVPMIATFTA